MPHYCKICDLPMDPDRCSDDELQEGVHSHCETSEVDSSRDNGHKLNCECPQCPPGTIGRELF